MTDTSFKPVLYLKKNCPFCIMASIFLLEAGLADTVEVREFTPGDDQEAAIRKELGAQLEKVSFPSLQLSPGVYMNESEAVIARLAERAGIDPKGLPLLQSYKEMLDNMIRVVREGMEYKKQAELAATA